MKEILLNEWVIASGIGFALVIIGRMLDDAKLNAAGFKHGAFVSKFCGGKIGKRGWEKLESFVQKCGLAYFKGFWAGLDSDDKKNISKGVDKNRETV